MALYKYDLVDFNKIHQESAETSIKDDVLKIIRELTQKVTSPGYVKTPQFTKKHDEWTTVLKFNKTEIKKVDEFDEIRKMINKLCNDNYDSLSCKILDSIEKCNDKSRISETIFAIASSNRFYSKLYAQLYEEIMRKNADIKTIFYEKCSDVMTRYNTIRCVNPDHDYELFCVINKENEQRKAVTVFLINLMLLSVVDEEFIMDILENLFLQVMDYKDDNDNIQIVNEIVEIIYIIMTHTDTKYETDKWKEMCVNAENMTKLTPKAGLSNKAIFKCMDIVDSLPKS